MSTATVGEQGGGVSNVWFTALLNLVQKTCVPGSVDQLAKIESSWSSGWFEHIT